MIDIGFLELGSVTHKNDSTLSYRSTTDAATFRKIYNIAAPFPKTDYYEPFRVPTPTIDLFVEKNEALHGKFKRQFSHVYSASGVKDLDSNIDASIEKFIAEIQKTEGTNVDLGKWFERLMLGTVLASLLGST